MLLPTVWRLLRTAPADGPWNMACDVALMESARTDGVGLLRVYEWSVPTVSFGRHESARGVYSDEALARAGLSAVRRPTGGRALLHSREVTYSVTMPIANDVRWSKAYDAVNLRLLRAMQTLGVPARIVGSPGEQSGPSAVAAPYADGHVCFSGIAPGEIAVEDRKLIASSVWRERGTYLQHGSILIHDDQHRLTGLMGAGAAPPERAAVLSDWLERGERSGTPADQVELALNEAFRDCGKCDSWSIPRTILDDVEVVRRRLAKPDWLWRR